ncbi:MAG: hypothetical protein ABSF26_31075, partial [Thermoguttaceae bacterium]
MWFRREWRSGRGVIRARARRLAVEALERRVLLSVVPPPPPMPLTYWWTQAGNGNWSDAADWSTTPPPAAQPAAATQPPPAAAAMFVSGASAEIDPNAQNPARVVVAEPAGATAAFDLPGGATFSPGRIAVNGGQLSLGSSLAANGQGQRADFSAGRVSVDSQSAQNIPSLVLGAAPIAASNLACLGVGGNGCIVGDAHAGTLQIGPSGRLNSALVAGNQAKSNGTASVRSGGQIGDENAAVSAVTVGNSGTGTLSVAAGGAVWCQTACIGNAAGGMGTVALNGDNPLRAGFVATRDLVMAKGTGSTATLIDADDADKVQAAAGDLGGGANSTTSITVRSLFAAGTNLKISGNAALAANGNGARATVAVEAGSLWTVGGSLTAGSGDGRNMVILDDQAGSFIAAQSIALGANVTVVGSGCLSAGDPDGTLENVTSSATIRPGDTFTPAAVGAGGTITRDVGNFTVLGNFRATASSILNIDIKGTDDGKYKCDQLIVSGQATVAGTLAVNLMGYTPRAGDRFPVVYAGGLYTGRFTLDTANAKLPAGLEWHLDYSDPSAIVLRVVKVEATHIAAVENSPYSGTVGTIDGLGGADDAAGFSAVIFWGGDTGFTTVNTTWSAAGQIVPDGEDDGGYVVDATHTYAEYGPYADQVFIDDGRVQFAALDAPVTVVDASLTVAPVTGLGAVEGQQFNGCVATLTDAGGGPWGDG